MQKFKLAVIGLGGIAENFHIPAWLANEEIELTAICDLSEEKALQVAAKYNVPQIYTDYNELLDSAEIDIIDICTPNFLHAEIATAALKKDKHVFCEKPEAVTIENILKLKETVEQTDRLFMAMRNNRFLNPSLFLKKLSDQGELGEVYAVRCGWVRRRGIPGRGGWFTNKKLSGGGVLIDLGVHMIDLAYWLMGSPTPTTVTGSTYSKFAENTARPDSSNSKFGVKDAAGVFDVEDTARGYVRFASGASLSLEFSWAANIEKERKFIEIMGTKAGAYWNYPDREIKLFSERNGITAQEIPNINFQDGAGRQENIKHFVDCLLGRTQLSYNIDQGIDVIKIINGIYQSAVKGTEVRF